MPTCPLRFLLPSHLVSMYDEFPKCQSTAVEYENIHSWYIFIRRDETGVDSLAVVSKKGRTSIAP